MPHYKLTYFNFRGLGETYQVSVGLLGRRLRRQSNSNGGMDVHEIKNTIWKGPVLEVDGKPVTQSIAIARWLGKKANLAGKDDWESLQIDIIIDTVNDMRMGIAQYWFEKNPEEKAKKLELVKKDTIPEYMSKFDQIVKDNGGYLANGALSWADLYFASIMDSFSFMVEESVLDKYPNLTALKEKVEELPKIKAWIAKRPVTGL